jgi:hypothetical protein
MVITVSNRLASFWRSAFSFPAHHQPGRLAQIERSRRLPQPHLPGTAPGCEFLPALNFLPAQRKYRQTEVSAHPGPHHFRRKNGSVVSGVVTSACTPAAEAVRINVPRLPGSRRRSATSRKSSSAGMTGSGSGKTASTPWDSSRIGQTIHQVRRRPGRTFKPSFSISISLTAACLLPARTPSDKVSSRSLRRPVSAPANFRVLR